MNDLNLRNLKVNEVLKFDDYHHVVLNDDIDLNGMLGVVKSIHQDKKYNLRAACRQRKNQNPPVAHE